MTLAIDTADLCTLELAWLLCCSLLMLGTEDITVNWGYPLVTMLLTLVVSSPIFLIVLEPE